MSNHIPSLRDPGVFTVGPPAVITAFREKRGVEVADDSPPRRYPTDLDRLAAAADDDAAWLVNRVRQRLFEKMGRCSLYSAQYLTGWEDVDEADPDRDRWHDTSELMRSIEGVLLDASHSIEVKVDQFIEKRKAAAAPDESKAA
ncbi:hypothetical protein [Stratiformator vulcanicus]|uniref:Uncharacterized protein n=1 Tax=Stratiformator vulcanicus TaxID=2527980 RepID=A0A517QY16_9PLAN|nr:hypothetical protein [Stratiformator vulcanicus]QDT36541.1 hypothetical protein Pan189_09010 [Stratiformator vulcanicus]